jgi:glutathione S-transferase
MISPSLIFLAPMQSYIWLLAATIFESTPMTATTLTLASHKLCPYVQRVAIALHEKGVAFERRWVDLAAKPQWFRAISPLGKTPVLVANGTPIFESAVICEYLDDTIAPKLHPADAIDRARHRAWIEFGSSVLNTVAAFYNAPDAASLEARRSELRERFTQLETEIEGPFFAGEEFSLVDAAFAPVFRYFGVFESFGEPSLFDAAPKVRAWRAALAQRDSVRKAAVDDYAERLRAFLLARGSELSRRIAAIA